MAKSSAHTSAARGRSTGATFTMTGAHAGPRPPAKGVMGQQAPTKGVMPAQQAAPAAPAAPPPQAPIVQPFLTPPQQAALDAWNIKYANDFTGLGYDDQVANVNYSRGLQADQLHNAQQGDLTNQSMAARGLFQSSIRDNALNDLSTTLAQQQNLLTTTRDTALFHNQQSRIDLTATNAAEQAGYWGLMVGNAQGVAPVTQPPDAAPTTPTPITATPPVAPRPPLAPKQPSPIGLPMPEPRSSSPNTNAARTRASGGLGVPGVRSGGVGVPGVRAPGVGVPGVRRGP